MTDILVRVNEHFGDNLLRLGFPEGWIIEESKMFGHDEPPLSDVQIRDAFSHPIGTPTIRELAKDKKGKIVVTCDDLSRPTPAYRVFPFIMKELHEAGIADDQIFILGSFGLHHPMNQDAFSRKVGWEMVAKYDCVNHNPFCNFKSFGRTSRGTPLLINEEFARADLRITVSGIKKHRWAGSGGGGKAIIPGVASEDTILWNHSITQPRRPEERAIWKIKDNPERIDMQEAARMVQLDVTVSCNYNGKRELIGLHVGGHDEAWIKAVRLGYKMHSTPSFNKKADIVIVNAYPQADQGIDWWGAQESLREGGTAIAIHHFPLGRAYLHYRSERMVKQWRRLQGYPEKRWPVKQAKNIIVFTDKLSRNHLLEYHDRVEWVTSWEIIIDKLKKLHGEEALVAVYPCGKIQFNPKRFPLII
jgi:nickel-dependent lactate racemase